MSFKISLIGADPIWDSLPVAKITHYPLEPRDYKPFAQARLCIGPEHIWVRMWAFEATPSPSSTLMVRLNLFPEVRDVWVSMSARHDKKTECMVVNSGLAHPMAEDGVLPRVKFFESEDLQGLYWGVLFDLPRGLLEKLYGTQELAPGKRVTGNFYKIDTDPASEHYGSFFPVDFRGEAPYDSQYFGDFELVEY